MGATWAFSLLAYCRKKDVLSPLPGSGPAYTAHVTEDTCDQKWWWAEFGSRDDEHTSTKLSSSFPPSPRLSPSQVLLVVCLFKRQLLPHLDDTTSSVTAISVYNTIPQAAWRPPRPSSAVTFTLFTMCRSAVAKHPASPLATPRLPTYTRQTDTGHRGISGAS
ncbi:hypothetical protein C8J57DRAFT_1722507 [Mycena rebaudengoi]|nr:hypothetical protein C8J57DRAFT_1722507 [Mycena rebaudengoi]